MVLYLDLETYSEVPINHGTYRYAEDAEVMLVAWAIGDGAVEVWDCTGADPMPHKLREALFDNSYLITAHNSMFDRTVLRLQWSFDPPIERWRDTMVQAYCHSLPGSLGALCDVFGVSEDKAKAKRGKQLVQMFCKPRPKSSKVHRFTAETHPKEWAEFVDYARLDVEAMREVARKVPNWNYKGAELALWHLDQRINDRGIAVDLDLARSALAAVEEEQKVLAERTLEMTGGEVQAATQRDAMLEHMLAEYGVALPDLTGSTIERRLDDPDIPEPMKDLLRVRLQASTTSTAKYKSLMRATSRDGRLRGLLQFAGAARTARWSGRTFQPQNLPRPTLKDAEIEAGIEALKQGAAGFVYSNVMEVASSAIRGCIVAPPGKKLVIADLSNIEGRALAWLAGEEWKLQAFREFDAGHGHDLYKLAYAKSFGVAPEAVTKDQRQVGKCQELALGYGGGVGAFATFAAAYGIDLEDLVGKVLPAADEELVAQARKFLDWSRSNDPKFNPGMSDDAFIACDVVKRGWRAGHPAICAFWARVGQAFTDAIENPEHTFDCGTVKVRRDGNWLRIRLPSGRYLCYPSPQIDDKGRCTYLGMNQYTRKWERINTYFGKIAENITQAFARDVLAYDMPLIEDAGYKIVLSVHDELLTETPDSPEFSSDQLAALMSNVPSWAHGLPLAAAGFETPRYRKD